MYRAANYFVFLLVIVGFLTQSCEKDPKTDSPLSGYIIENTVRLTLKGTYNKIKLDEDYLLSVTKDYISLNDTQLIIYSFEGIDTVQYQIAEFEILSKELDSRMSFEILFNDISNEVNYYHNLTKMIDENQVVYIEGQNSYVVPLGTNKEVPPESLPKIYRIKNFAYNPNTGSINFDFSVQYDDGVNTNYSLDGTVEIFVYNN